MRNFERNLIGSFIQVKLFFIILVIAALLSACGGSRQHRKEMWYDSAVWSPDGNQVAYFRRLLEYDQKDPLISLFVAAESSIIEVKQDKLFLCVNDISGKNEKVLKEIKYDLPQPDQYTIPRIFTRIAWTEEGILYGAGVKDIFSTGVQQISSEGGDDRKLSNDFESVATLKPGFSVLNGLELYVGPNGNYGYFNDQTIYIFDHNAHTVKVYLHDPLSTKQPFVPPYSVTQP